MSERNWMQPIVERVVGEALDSHAAQLQGEIVSRVMREIQAQAEVSAVPSASAASLAVAVSGIQAGSSQKEILRALLDSSACCATRVALFVVKGGQATGWQGRGFAGSETIKDFALDANAPAVSRAISERTPTCSTGADFDDQFLERFGAPKGEARLMPLILKDKVAALVYADGGTDGGLFDAGATEVLALSTSAWLEVNALRKQAHKEALAAPAETQGAPASEAAPAPAFNDPFAAHTPAYAMAAAASGAAPETVVTTAPSREFENTTDGQSSAVEVQSAGVMASEAIAEPLPIGAAQSDVEVRTEPDAVPSLSPEDQQVHAKAKRFARLLVDEIKLYNQAKVSEGRKSKDLYERLQDTIDKSRITYQKRYGNTVAASGNYFQHELVRSLAEDDASLMGSNFHL